MLVHGSFAMPRHDHLDQLGGRDFFQGLSRRRFRQDLPHGPGLRARDAEKVAKTSDVSVFPDEYVPVIPSRIAASRSHQWWAHAARMDCVSNLLKGYANASAMSAASASAAALVAA